MKTCLDSNQQSRLKELYQKTDETFILSSKLTKPTRGTLSKCFEKTGYRFHTPLFVRDYYEQFTEWEDLVNKQPKGNNGLQMKDVINFRNHYAHGATANGEECIQDILNYEPILIEMLHHPFFHQTSVVVFDEQMNSIFHSQVDVERIKSNNPDLEPFKPYLVNQQLDILPLFPLVHFENIKQERVPSILFFNDLKRMRHSELSLLDYPNAYHHYERYSYKDFEKMVKIKEWSRLISEEFKEVVYKLSDSFMGREVELGEMYDFVRNHNNGYLFIYGGPGIGKSSLIAKYLLDTKYNRQKEESHGVYIEYFIKRNSIYSTPAYFLDSLQEKLELAFPFLQKKSNQSLHDKANTIHKHLKQVSQHLKSQNQKLIFIIDGLDEGKETGLLNYLFTESYANILTIFSSRIDEEVQRLEQGISSDQCTIHLGKMSPPDIRGLLYQVADKYEIISKDDFYETIILEKSEGNPLYLKLLCQDIENQEVALDTIENIPEKLTGLYDEILSRFRTNKHDTSILFDSLCVFAVVKEHIDKYQLETILREKYDLSPIAVEGAINQLREILQSHPSMDDSYQLFHESLRDYLFKKYPDSIIEVKKWVISYCSKWETLTSINSSVTQYPLKHYAVHLCEAGSDRKLLDLLRNKQYIVKQIDTTQQYHYSFELYRVVQEYISKQLKMEEDVTSLQKQLLLEVMEGFLRIHDYFHKRKIFFTSNLQVDQIQDWLQQFYYYNPFEKAVAYLYILRYLLKTKEKQLDLICLVLQQIDNDCDLDNSYFAEHVPLVIVLEIIHLLELQGIDYGALKRRITFASLLPIVKDFNYDVEIERTIINLIPSDYTEDETFKVLVDIADQLIKNGHRERSNRLIKEILNGQVSFYETGTFYRFIQLLYKVGETEQAAKLMKNMKNSISNDGILADVLDDFSILDLIYLYDYDLYQILVTRIMEEFKGQFMYSTYLRKLGSHYAKNNLFTEHTNLYPHIRGHFEKGFYYTQIYGLSGNDGNNNTFYKKIATWIDQIRPGRRATVNNLGTLLYKAILKHDEIMIDKIKKVQLKERELQLKEVEAYLTIGDVEKARTFFMDVQDDEFMLELFARHLVKSHHMNTLYQLIDDLSLTIHKQHMIVIAALEAISQDDQVLFEELLNKVQDTEQRKKLSIKHAEHDGMKSRFNHALSYLFSKIKEIEQPMSKNEKDELELAVMEQSILNRMAEAPIPFNIEEYTFQLAAEGYRRLVRAAIRVHEFHWALSLVRRIEPLKMENNWYLKSELYLIIVEKMCEINAEGALEVLMELFDVGGSIKNYHEYLETIFSCAKYFYQRGQLKEEERILVNLEKRISKSNGYEYHLLAFYYHETNREKYVKRLLRRAIESIKKNGRGTAIEYKVSLVYTVLYYAEKMDLLLFAKEKMKKIGLSDFLHVVEQNLIESFPRYQIQHCLQDNQFSQALKIIDEKCPDNEKDSHYLLVLEKMVKHGEIDIPILIVEAIVDEEKIIDGFSLVLGYFETESQLSTLVKKNEDVLLHELEGYTMQDVWKKGMVYVTVEKYLLLIQLLDTIPATIKGKLEDSISGHLMKRPDLYFHFLSKVTLDTSKVYRTLMSFSYYLRYFSEAFDERDDILARMIDLLGLDWQVKSEKKLPITSQIRQQIELLENNEISLQAFKEFVQNL